MMGKAEEEGIIPQICQDLFKRIYEDKDTGLKFSVEVRDFFYLLGIPYVILIIM